MQPPKVNAGGGPAPAQRGTMARRHMPMTGWYNPLLLLQTGIRVGLSTVFERLGDRREIIAVSNPIAAHPFDRAFDYSSSVDTNGDFWFDFAADTGDGWDSTFAIARLVTNPSIRVGEFELPRGRILLFGGDEVYPTPSRQAYQDRLLGPFEDALAILGPDDQRAMPDLYAMPGNHDWYDGLSSFMALFCRRRVAPSGDAGIDRPGRPIAGRKTFQTRTYFALEFPHGWWLWGTDSQIQGYLDQPQVDFFQYVASNWMQPKSKVILCSGQPSWAYADPRAPEVEFTTFSYLERLPGMAKSPSGETMGHELKLVLTGDSHHYSRYSEDGALHYVTAGGGGAFLHPTHHLKDRVFDWNYPAPGRTIAAGTGKYQRHFKVQQKIGGTGDAVFPDRAKSRSMTARNVAFAFLNPGMLLLYWIGYAIYYWSLEASSLDATDRTLGQLLGEQHTYWSALRREISTGFATPWPTLLFVISLFIYVYFVDEPYAPLRRRVIGVLHGILHAAVVTGIGAASFWMAGKTGARTLLFSADLVPIGVGSLIAGFLSATLLGCYLWIALNFLNIHWDEAYSSLRIKDFKNFLRLRIAADGSLEVYPIGLTRVPRNNADAELTPHLIEGPIHVSGL